jgi:hypothetical protein
MSRRVSFFLLGLLCWAAFATAVAQTTADPMALALVFRAADQANHHASTAQRGGNSSMNCSRSTSTSSPGRKSLPAK